MAQQKIQPAQVTISKSDIGLGSVDNTADTAKPISTAQATAIALKVDNSKIAASGMGVCVHGSTGSTTRPTGYLVITWIGIATPANATTNDIWISS